MSDEKPSNLYIDDLLNFRDALLREYGTTATVTTTCARCSATIDPAAVERHHERCFVVGDAVVVGRCDHDLSSEGKSGKIARIDFRALGQGARYLPFLVKLDKASATHGDYVWCEDIRRIQRPGQAVLSERSDGNLYYGDIKLTDGPPVTKPRPKLSAEGQATYDRLRAEYGSPPAPTLYDGLTAEQCLERWQRRQREDGAFPFAGQVRYPTRDTVLTAAQLAAARELWSLQLKQRISAAKERERLTVTYCEMDVEDEPW